MAIGDILVILFFIIGIFLGYKYGLISVIVYTIIIAISTLASGLINKFVSNILYYICPFFNFSGKLTGVKAINILLYRVLFFIIFIIIFIMLFNKLLARFKIKDKIIDKMVESSVIFQILGSVFSIFISYVASFVLILIFTLPCFNINVFNDSSVAQIIITKMPILSSSFSKIYDSNIESYYVLDQYEKEEFEIKNDEVKQILINNDIIEEKKLKKLNKKLKGHLPKIKEEKEDKEDEENQDDEYYDDQDEEYYDDEYYDDEYYDDQDEEYYDDEYYDEDEEYYDDEYYDDQDDEY